MRRILLALAAVMMVAVWTSVSWGQYPYSQYNSGYPYTKYQRPQSGPPVYGYPGLRQAGKDLYIRMTPDPALYWQWNQYNRFLDRQYHLRSPGNPESELDYLMRTF